MTPSQEQIQTIVEDLLKLAPHADKTAHSPGSITLKLKLSGLSILSEIDLDEFEGSVPGIEDVQIRLLSRSVTITYDPAVFPFETWESIWELTGSSEGEPRLRAELAELIQRHSA